MRLGRRLAWTVVAATAVLGFVAVWPVAGARAASSGGGVTICEGLPRASGARFVSTPLPARVLSSYGVLRRARALDDLPPGPVLAPPLSLLDRVDRPYVRLLGVLGVQRFYLVPGYMKPRYLPSDCLRGLSRRERRELRRQAQRYARQLLLCLDELGPTFGSQGCGPFDPYYRDPGFSASGGRLVASPRHPLTLSALIPDGVARVVARYHGGPSFDLPVLSNLVVFQITHSTKRRLHVRHRRKPVVLDDPFPYSTTWLADDGHVIKRFRSPLSTL